MDPARRASEGGGTEREAGLKMVGALAIEQRMAVPEGNAITLAYVMGQTLAGAREGAADRMRARRLNIKSKA